MRKIVYSLQMSLDGYIEDRDGSIGFTIPEPELHAYMNALESTIDTHIYGRRLFETMDGFWPNAADDPDAAPEMLEYAHIWNGLDKIVFSETLTTVTGKARLARGDIASEVDALKSQPGKDISVGGATLARAFIDLDLVDEFWVIVYPVLLGGGKPMFGEFSQRLHLELYDSRRFSSGVMALLYRRKRED